MSGPGNGNETRALIEACEALLADTSVLSYYRERLPSATDAQLDALLGRGLALTDRERDKWMAGLPPEVRSLYGIFSHRAATLAARTTDPAGVRNGLMASVVANYVIPEKRNVTPMLALLHHVAVECGADPGPMFREAAAIASEEMAVHLLEFAGREDLILSRYGWRKIGTPDGVQFKFDWR